MSQYLPLSDMLHWLQLHNVAYMRFLQISENLWPTKLFVWSETWPVSLIISQMFHHSSHSLLDTWVFQYLSGQSCSGSVPTTHPCAQPDSPGRQDPCEQCTAQGEACMETILDLGMAVLEALPQDACRIDAGSHQVRAGGRWYFPEDQWVTKCW